MTKAQKTNIKMKYKIYKRKLIEKMNKHYNTT